MEIEIIQRMKYVRCILIIIFQLVEPKCDSSGLNVPPVALSNVPGTAESIVPLIAETNVPGVSL